MEEPTPSRQPAHPASVPAVSSRMAATIAAGFAAVACLLPWYRIDLSTVTSALDASMRGAMGGAVPGIGGLQGMFSGLGISGTVNVAGTDSWVGVAALVACALVALLHLIEASAASAQSRRSLLVMAVVASVAGVGLALYSVTQLGGPIGIHVGLVAVLIAVIVSAVLSVRRMLAVLTPSAEQAA